MKSINLRLTMLFLICGLLLNGSRAIAQSIPQTITFQGKLLENGNAVTGSREFTFSFLGTAWTETHPAVQVTDGLYSVILGSVTPIPFTVFSNNATATLHIVVGTDALSPDITISSSPYAFKAEKADAAATAASATTALSADNASAISGIGVSADYPLGNQYLRFNGSEWAPANGDWQLNAPNHLLNLNEGNVYIGNLIGNGKLSVYATDQIAVDARTTGNTGINAQMVSATEGTGIGYGNSKAAVQGYAYNGRQYHYGVAGYRYPNGEGNSAGVFGAVSDVASPLAWGALGYEDTEFGSWGGYFHGNVFTDGQLKITGGSPGAGKVLSSDANGLASWVTSPVSSQWVSSGQNIYYYPAGGGGYVGIGTDAPLAALHLKSADVYNDFHTMEVENTSTSAAVNHLYGIYSKINTTSSGSNAAIIGYAAGVTGNAIGVSGISAADQGIGVYAGTSSSSDYSKALMAVASTDNSYAGYFLNGKSYFSGRVGFGVANPTYQVEMTGEDVTYSGTILNVENTASEMNDFSMAIQAKINTSASANAGTAVNGISVNTVGSGIGVTGRTSGISGKGVVGIASHASGENYGVYGRTYSSSGYAGYFMGGKNYFEGNVGIGTDSPSYKLQVIGGFSISGGRIIDVENTSSVGLPNIGAIYGKINTTATLSAGSAIYGYSAATSGGGIGVKGETNGLTGKGVTGIATNASGVNYAVYGSVTSSDGYAGYFSGGKNYFSGPVGIGTNSPDYKLHVTSSNLTTMYIENTFEFGAAASFVASGPNLMQLRNSGTGLLMDGYNATDKVVDLENNGTFNLYNSGNIKTIKLDAEEYGTGDGAQISLWNGAGSATILLDADEEGVGRITADAAVLGGAEVQTDGTIIIKNGSDVPTIKIDPSESAPAEGGQISLWNASGVASILIDGDFNNSGRGRISTNELEITGGADIAEPFLVNNLEEIEPGTVLCIDPVHAGQLKIASASYDRCVAGIVSGASDINPGLILKQSGSQADGKHLVALTGRVYCKADASKKPIKPGDLLTTSELPGFAMLADDLNRAQGAILGKAMTGLENGTGLILVLVTLQ